MGVRSGPGASGSKPCFPIDINVECTEECLWSYWTIAICTRWLKYTEIQSQSQQIAVTESTSLRNNPMILTNYLIHTLVLVFYYKKYWE